MDLSLNKKSANKNNGPMKTTTWGAVVVFSLLLAGLGLASHVSNPVGNSQVLQTAANIASSQVPTPPLSPRTSHDSGSIGSGLNSVSILDPSIEARANSSIAAQPFAPTVGSVLPNALLAGAKAQPGP